MNEIICTNCDHRLTYRGEYALPGAGQSYKCLTCGREHVKIGKTLISTDSRDFVNRYNFPVPENV